MKKIKKAFEMDIFGLVEASLQEQSILGDTQKKKITGFHRFKDLAVKGFDILLEEVVSARVELARLDRAHESGHKLLHGAWQRVIRFALVWAHPHLRCLVATASLIAYAKTSLMSMGNEAQLRVTPRI